VINLLGWLFKVLGYHKKYEFSEEDRQWAEVLKQIKRQNQLMAMGSIGKNNKNSLGDIRDNIESVRDIAEDMGWMDSSGDESIEKQLTKTVLNKMMGQTKEPTTENITEQEGNEEFKRLSEAIRSGKIDKKQFDQVANEFYKQNKALSKKKGK